MTEYTTIQITKETASKLNKFKQHPRATYEEAINTLIGCHEIARSASSQ